MEETGKGREVWTINGKSSSSKESGLAMVHLTTFVWSQKDAGTKLDCEIFRVKGRNARSSLTASGTGNAMMRVRDVATQVNFVLYGPARKICDYENLHKVANEPHMFKRYETVTSFAPRPSSFGTLSDKFSLNLTQERSPGYLQVHRQRDTRPQDSRMSRQVPISTR